MSFDYCIGENIVQMGVAQLASSLPLLLAGRLLSGLILTQQVSLVAIQVPQHVLVGEPDTGLLVICAWFGGMDPLIVIGFLCCFLAVQNSSIGDLVTDSLTHSVRVLLLLTYKE